MRIVTALGLCVAVTAACASRKEKPEPAPSEGAMAQEGEVEPQQTPGDYSQELADSLSLQEQKKSFLVESYLQHARELKERLELEQAEQELARALQLDPDNLEAKNMLSEVGALLGREPGAAQTTIQELENLMRLKRDQLEVDVRQKIDKARLAAGRGDWDSALVELTLAQDE